MTTAEWMFGDQGELARYNPFSWGGRAIDETVQQLEGLSTEHKRRPIVLKIPAACLSPEQRFDNAGAAIAHLRQPMPLAEWMFGDVSSFAKLIPSSWSGPLPIEAVIEQLQGQTALDSVRPKLVKVPAGVFTPERYFQDGQHAIDHLRKVKSNFEKALNWSVVHKSRICGLGEEHLFMGKAPLLPSEEYSSVNEAIKRLNNDSSICPKGMCVVLSKSDNQYVLLYRGDVRSDALTLFGIRKQVSWGEWKSSKAPVSNFATDFVGRFVVLGCDSSEPTSRFDNSRLAVRHVERVMDRYEPGKVLGSGVGGIVSLVTRKHTDRKYAMKVAKSEGLEKEESESWEKELVAEAMKLQALRHPNCAKIVEMFEDPTTGKSSIICEVARGGDLSDYMEKVMKNKTLTEKLVMGIFKHAVSGLAYLHAARCVHNDVKPDNLLVVSEYQPHMVPRVILTDYGKARFAAESSLDFGDPRYLSPEMFRAQLQLRSDPDTIVDISPAGDMWSIGMTLFELLSGCLPFLYERCTLARFQDEEGVFEKFQENLLGPGQVSVRPLCSEELASIKTEGILKRLLSKDEYSRASAGEVLNELKHASRASLDSAGAKPVLVELFVQQDPACQILLNAVVWKMPFDHLIQTCFDVFEAFDINSSGSISRVEFKEALITFLPEELRARADEVADEVFNMADIDDDNQLEFNEFAAISFNWEALDADTLDKYVEELLHDIGRGENAGTITEQELFRFFANAVKEDILSTLFKHIDMDGDGCISAREVGNFLRNHRVSALPAILVKVQLP